jgi:hypothetical protein
LPKQSKKTVDKNAAIVKLWNAGVLSFKLHAAQKIIYQDLKKLDKDTREVLIFCARRFGKSYLGLILALEKALSKPNIQVAIVGPTLKQTTNITTPLLKKIAQDAPIDLIKRTKSEARWNLSNGSTLLIGGYDSIAESLRGLELAEIYLEETGQATPDSEEYNYILYSILYPTLMHSRGRLVHLTTPSRIIDHPLHTETLPKCRLSNSFYLYDIEKNPLLSKEDITKEIELLGGSNSIAVLRELYCEIVRDDSITVVTTFDEARHVAELTPTHPLKYCVGGDLGYTNDLSAFVLAGYDHNLGKVLVLNELSFEPETPSKKIVDTLNEQWGQYKPTYIVDIQGNTRTDMSGLGLSTVTPIKDKFDSTITFIRNEFYQDKLHIDTKCTLLIETLRSGIFNKQKTDFKRTASLYHLDMLMALVYLLRSIDKSIDLRPKPSKQNMWIIEAPDKNINNIKQLGYFK